MSSAPPPLTPWYRTTLPIALLGSVLLWAAMPASLPLSLGWLGWIAPIPWLLLVQRDSMPGRRPYGALYLAGLAFWLMTIHWIRLPHPALYAGWISLSAYLAFYLPVFVGLTRIAVHRVGVPLWLAAPVVWTGLELARAHLLTGFLMASLAHTQANWTQLIQISDLFGEYGVDFVVMLVAACIAKVLTLFPPQRTGFLGTRRGEASSPPSESVTSKKHLRFTFNLAPAAIVLALTLLYGHNRLDKVQHTKREAPKTARIALIQGNSLADWKTDQTKQKQIMDEYIGLSAQVIEQAKTLGDGRPIDLIVWPETMYRNPLREFEPDFQMPTEAKATPEEVMAADRRSLADLVAHLKTPVLVGIDRIQFLAGETPEGGSPALNAYNSAVMVDSGGQVVGTYDKFHLVVFGEYVPFSQWLPFLNKLSSLTGSVLAGDGPVALCMGGVCYVPNICYETVIPHVTRRQATLLMDGTKSPGVLVNMTNDAWYWGSNELDQHLACGVFRAVETRRPLVIAANGGISAWIDHAGAVREKSPKRQPDVILADVELGQMYSWYIKFGDWFAGVCLICCVLLAIIGFLNRR